MRFKADRATRLRVGMTTLLAVALLLTGCTSDPVATPSAPLTLQSDLSVLAPSTPEPSAMTSGQQTRPPSSSPGARPSIATDTPTSPRPSTVSSTVRPSTPDSSRTPRPPTTPAQISGAKTPKPTTAVPASGGTLPTEAADRKAVEAAWVRFWMVYIKLVETPKSKREKVYGTVAVDPQLTKLLRTAEIADAEKVANFGSVVHRFYWDAAISTTSDAVLGDCMDQSKFGVYDISSNKALSMGESRVNIQATLKRSGSSWKVVGYVEKRGTSC